MANVGEDECRGEKKLCPLLVGIYITPDTVETSMERPQKLKIKLPRDPAVPLLGICSKESESA
jgi:hypothetical protein